MSETAIEWTHRPGTKGRTWNPTKGCSRISEGCRHCYAEQQGGRIVRMGKGKPTIYDDLVKKVGDEWRWTGKVPLFTDVLSEPLRWRDPSTVFVNSMSDLFHESLSNEQIAAVFGVMAATPQHTYIILTKRAKRMREWFEWISNAASAEQLTEAAFCAVMAQSRGSFQLRRETRDAMDKTTWPLASVWLGVSVENQDAADERIPELLETPAVIRLLSCEPLLGPVDAKLRGCFHEGAGTAERPDELEDHSECAARISWVISGCESGQGARRCEAEWLRSLRDQCDTAGVPYFLKQATAWDEGRSTIVAHGIGLGPGSHHKASGVIGAPYLDGKQHLAFPR